MSIVGERFDQNVKMIAGNTAVDPDSSARYVLTSPLSDYVYTADDNKLAKEIAEI